MTNTVLIIFVAICILWWISGFSFGVATGLRIAQNALIAKNSNTSPADPALGNDS